MGFGPIVRHPKYFEGVIQGATLSRTVPGYGDETTVSKYANEGERVHLSAWGSHYNEKGPGVSSSAILQHLGTYSLGEPSIFASGAVTNRSGGEGRPFYIGTTVESFRQEGSRKPVDFYRLLRANITEECG